MSDINYFPLRTPRPTEISNCRSSFKCKSFGHDLRRTGIEPFTWIAKQSFAGSCFRDPVLVERGIRELPYLLEVCEQLSRRIVVIPWMLVVPKGLVRVQEFVNQLVEKK